MPVKHQLRSQAEAIWSLKFQWLSSCINLRAEKFHAVFREKSNIVKNPSCPAPDGDCVLTLMIYLFRMRVMASAAAAEHHLQMIAWK